jgi:hypothetical protein
MPIDYDPVETESRKLVDRFSEIFPKGMAGRPLAGRSPIDYARPEVDEGPPGAGPGPADLLER